MMHMTFYWGRQVTILFDFWQTDSWLSYALSLFALLLAAVFYQYMDDRRIRLRLLSRPKPTSFLEAPLLDRAAGSPAATRAASTVLFGVNSAIGYLLMLAVMSFNWGVFIAVVVGLSLGYLAFRSEEASAEGVVDATDSGHACV